MRPVACLAAKTRFSGFKAETPQENADSVPDSVSQPAPPAPHDATNDNVTLDLVGRPGDRSKGH
jgi:hypothetical protein